MVGGGNITSLCTWANEERPWKIAILLRMRLPDRVWLARSLALVAAPPSRRRFFFPGGKTFQPHSPWLAVLLLSSDLVRSPEGGRGETCDHTPLGGLRMKGQVLSSGYLLKAAVHGSPSSTSGTDELCCSQFTFHEGEWKPKVSFRRVTPEETD